MDKVPTIISTKDLDYLNDIFSWNFGVCKLAYSFSQKVSDEEIKQELENTYNMHKEICQSIVNILG